MAKKLPVYMWELLFNRLTRISTEYAHKVLGVIPSSLTRYIQNRTYNQKLECYFIREPLSVKEKRQLIQQIEIPNEVWRETKLEGLYVSDHARFRAKTNTGWRYYFVFNQKGYPFIKYQKKHYRANRLGTYKINKGDKLAQLVIVPIWTPELKEVEEFSYVSERGTDGFGSTGY